MYEANNYSRCNHDSVPKSTQFELIIVGAGSTCTEIHTGSSVKVQRSITISGFSATSLDARRTVAGRAPCPCSTHRTVFYQGIQRGLSIF